MPSRGDLHCVECPRPMDDCECRPPRYLPVSWTTLIAKPEYARTVPLASQELLATLEALMPPLQSDRQIFHSDRYVVMGEWLRKAEQLGLIRGVEYSQLRTDLAQVM